MITCTRALPATSFRPPADLAPWAFDQFADHVGQASAVDDAGLAGDVAALVTVVVLMCLSLVALV